MFLIKLIAALAYISLGLPDAMLGIAWPGMRRELQLPLNYVGYLLASTFSGYLLSSSLAHHLARRIGIGWLLVLSSSLMTLVLSGFAISHSFYSIILLGFCGGCGGGAIDASLNSFSAHRFSLRMVNWLHGFWGVGAFCGPMLMTFILVHGLSWRWAYAALAVVLACTTLLLASTRSRWTYADELTEHQPTHVGLREVFFHRQVLGQCILFFVYTGIESTIGQLLFTVWTESRHVSPGWAGLAITSYWVAFTLSRFLIGQLSMHWSGRRILLLSALGTPCLAVLIAFPPLVYVDLIAVGLLGALIAPVFPTWIGLTPQTVPPGYAAQAIGFQVSAAAIGIAVLPAVISSLATSYGLELIPLALLTLVGVLSIGQFRLLRSAVATMQVSRQI